MTRATVSDSSATAAPQPRRRRRMALAVAAGVAAVILALVAALARYQPLRQVDDLETSGEVEAVLVEGFEETGAHIVRYDHGEHVAYAFTVRNDGPVGVTVTGVALPDEGQRRLLQPVQASVVPDGSGSIDGPGEMQPLRPFPLRPGEKRRITVRARFGNCEYYTERAVETLDGQVVGFRVAGVPRTATIRFDRPLLVRSPSIQDCDERTLDRSEHRRTDP